MNGESNVLRVLLIEDSAIEAELLVRELKSLGRPIEPRRVASAVDMVDALARFFPHIILSDYSMPGFSGREALVLALQHAPAIPFIYVSGTIGEDRAIEALHGGASDYVLKDNLRRLPISVARALRVAAEANERCEMQTSLEESEQRFRVIVETSQDWIWENDADLRLKYSNGAIRTILGYAPEELCGKHVISLMLPEDRDAAASHIATLAQEGRGWQNWRRRWTHRDGSIRTLESTGTPLFGLNNEVIGYRGVDRDITRMLRQEAKIRKMARIQDLLTTLTSSVLRTTNRQELLENACRVAVENGGFKAAGIALRDPDGSLSVAATYGNREMLDVVNPGERMDGCPQGEYAHHPSLVACREGRIIAIPDFALVHPADSNTENMLRNGVRSQVSLPIGAQPWGVLALYSSEPREYDGEELALLSRITQEIGHAEHFLDNANRLEYLAYHNPVTGLPSRAAFQVFTRSLGKNVVVAAISLRRFGRINSSRGRVFGDSLLKVVGERIKCLLPAGAFVAHPESATFLVSVSASRDEWLGYLESSGLMEALESQPVEVDGETVHVALRAGTVGERDFTGDVEALERKAMVALAEATDKAVVLQDYTEALSTRAARRVSLEADLRRAIDRREFELFYQPKFMAGGTKLIGAEALVRWRHPSNGLISPAEFIPVLEETGLIVQVGHWVMQEALATALRWQVAGNGLRVAVNVSARELRQQGFLQRCREMLSPLAPDQPLDIEITESVLMDDIDENIKLLRALRSLGCKLAIDDFGTGYSSLNYLVRLPIDTIKIDRSFISELDNSPETMALVTNMISLAHSLKLDVVAEGVETEEQRNLLHLLRCDVLQGFLLGKPVPVTRFEATYLASGGG